MCSSAAANEVVALRALFDSTNGSHWNWLPRVFGNVWTFNTSNPSPCLNKWQGISCLSTSTTLCHVYDLTLVNYDLQGTLTEALADLTFLHSLIIAKNDRLTGSFPIPLEI